MMSQGREREREKECKKRRWRRRMTVLRRLGKQRNR